MNETGRSQERVQEDLQKCFTSTIVVSPDSLNPAPSASSTLKNPENTQEDADIPEPSNQGDVQMEYASD
jgi:hypothetical protein